METNKFLNSKRLSLIAGSILLGVVLVFALDPVLGFDFSNVLKDVLELNHFYVFLVVAGTFLAFWITALKWRIVTESTPREDSLDFSYFKFTVLNVLLNQFIPQQLSTIFVRSYFLKVQQQIPVMQGALTTIYDLLFDLSVILSVSVPALLVITGMISQEIFIVILLSTLIVVGLIIIFYIRLVIRFLAVLSSKIPFLRNILGKSEALRTLASKKELTLFSLQITIKLYFLSIAKFSILLVRNYLIVLALGAPISFFAIAVAQPITMLSGLLSLTPANLGVAEWTFVGVLAPLGISAQVSSQFVVVRRVLLTATVFLISLLFLPFLKKKYHRDGIK